MSMVFEKERTLLQTGRNSFEDAYRIRRIEGVLPRECLPREYLNSENCLFQVTSRNGHEGVIVLHDSFEDGDLDTEVIKIFPGKAFTVDDWTRIMEYIREAGDRLHDVRTSARQDRDVCTDLV